MLPELGSCRAINATVNVALFKCCVFVLAVGRR